MRPTQHGFTLIELLAGLAVAGMVTIGLAAMMDTSMEDIKGQQTALHQMQVVSAAAKYVTDHYAQLTTGPGAATASTPAAGITVAMLRSGGYLSSNFSDTNAYGQTPCVLVLQPSANKLDALVVTEGGTSIPARAIGYVAANAGQGGGYIPASTGTPAPLVAVGAFGSTQVSNATLSKYLAVKCTATAATAGHLANSLFYDGPGRLTTDFVYRDAVPGHPELNRMTTPLHITLAAGAVENTSDASCSPTDSTTWSGVVVNANGVILSCQSGIWRRDGSRYWRDPVTTYAVLAALPASDNSVGDVRMVTQLSRAFTWNGSAWVALAVDQNGLLTTDQVQLNSVVVAGGACTSNGLVARDANGLVLSCQSLKWATQSTIELGATDTGCQRIRASKYSIPTDQANCPTIFSPQSSITYSAGTDTYVATISKTVTATKNGLISVNAWSQMNRGLVAAPDSAEGQVSLLIILLDSANNVIATSQAQSPALYDDSAGINVSLSKSVPQSSGAYTVQIVTKYTLFDGGTIVYNESNYQLPNGTKVQQTPLMTGWNIDLFY
jgi:prepilin-type N-terminal cleavage/methylation domain-containing protein